MHVVTSHERALPAPAGMLAFATALGVMLATTVWGALGVMIAISIGVAAWAAVIDVRSGRIPNRLVLVATIPTSAVVLASIANGGGVELAGSVALGVLAFAGPIFVVHVVSPQSIGFGDVKLAAALGATLGTVEPALGVLALFVATSVTAAAGLVGRRSTMPFGPGLVVGAIVALAVAAQLGELVAP